MHGGGYKNFLQEVKKESSLNRIATFIIVDGDRAQNINGELKALQELQKYCERQNNKNSLRPYFLIVNTPDFEYISCLHDSEYSGGDVTKHIKNNFRFADITAFKSNARIYEFLNSGKKNYQNMLKQIEKRPKLISNRYKTDGMIISLTATDTFWNLIEQRGSNIEEIFDIISNN